MLPTITTWPSPDRSSAGRKARVTLDVPRKFTSHIHRHASSSASATGSRPTAPPALLTSTRTSGTCETKVRTDSPSDTSSDRARPPISPAISSSRSSRLAPRTISNPEAASARAVAAPIPADAPVTTATPRSLTPRQLIQAVLGGTLAGMLESDPGIREHLEALMPPGGRARRLVGWGVVAWNGIGGVILVWAAANVLSRFAGVFPYLVMAAMVVFVLNPAVSRLTGLGLPRRPAATVVFVVALGLTALVLS